MVERLSHEDEAHGSKTSRSPKLCLRTFKKSFCKNSKNGKAGGRGFNSRQRHFFTFALWKVLYISRLIYFHYFKKMFDRQYSRQLTRNEIVDYLLQKKNIFVKESFKYPERKDIHFGINSADLGRISVDEYGGKYTLSSPIYGKSSKIKEDDRVLEQIASRYGVKIFHGEGNGTVYATKEVTSHKDIDSFYDFCLRNKNARYLAGGDQSKLSLGLEQLLGFSPA